MIMNIFFENTVTSELIVVYGLIALVLILIVVILILDKKEKSRKKDLFNNRFINTVKMKPVAGEKTKIKSKEELKSLDESLIKEKKEQPKSVAVVATRNKKENNQTLAEEVAINDLEDLLEKTAKLVIPKTEELNQRKIIKVAPEAKKDNIEIKTKKEQAEKQVVQKLEIEDDIIDISDTQIISVKEIKQSLAEKTEKLKRTEGIVKEPLKKKEIEQLEELKEEELSKTQAQISLEALHKELEKAIASERNNIDNLEQLEEDEAIISYDQLVKVSDKIYEKNDSSEYLDENDYPITIDELRKKFQQEMTEVKSENNEIAKVQLQEFVDENEIEQLATSKQTSTVRETFFRTTPIISPVYGIQNSRIDDAELLSDSNDDLDSVNSETASELLNRLKEFTSNH